MKTFKTLAFATVIGLAGSGAAFAGDIAIERPADQNIQQVQTSLATGRVTRDDPFFQPADQKGQKVKALDSLSGLDSANNLFRNSDGGAPRTCATCVAGGGKVQMQDIFYSRPSALTGEVNGQNGGGGSGTGKTLSAPLLGVQRGPGAGSHVKVVNGNGAPAASPGAPGGHVKVFDGRTGYAPSTGVAPGVAKGGVNFANTPRK